MNNIYCTKILAERMTQHGGSVCDIYNTKNIIEINHVCHECNLESAKHDVKNFNN